jgi:hypothetical protein
MKDSSILHFMLVGVERVHIVVFVPLLGHHQESLNKQTLQDLRSNTLEKSHCALMLDDVVHDFGEGLERLAVPRWRWLRLKTNFGDDEGLRSNSRKCL